jgi:DNA repair protein RecO (recombination protein O)
VRINQCELIESFLEAQREYAVRVALALVSEVSEAVLPEREPADAAFRLVLLTARVLERESRVGLPLAYFSLWTVRLGGWLPQLDRCARCGRELGAGGAFGSPMHPGMVCRQCRLPGMRAISAAGLALAQRMLTQKLDGLMDQDWPAAPVKEVNAYLLDLIEHQIERKLTTRGLLESHEGSSKT